MINSIEDRFAETLLKKLHDLCLADDDFFFEALVYKMNEKGYPSSGVTAVIEDLGFDCSEEKFFDDPKNHFLFFRAAKESESPALLEKLNAMIYADVLYSEDLWNFKWEPVMGFLTQCNDSEVNQVVDTLYEDYLTHIPADKYIDEHRDNVRHFELLKERLRKEVTQAHVLLQELFEVSQKLKNGNAYLELEKRHSWRKLLNVLTIEKMDFCWDLAYSKERFEVKTSALREGENSRRINDITTGRAFTKLYLKNLAKYGDNKAELHTIKDCIRLGLDEDLIKYTFHDVVPNAVYDRLCKKTRFDLLYPRAKELAKTKETPVR